MIKVISPRSLAPVLLTAMLVCSLVLGVTTLAQGAPPADVAARIAEHKDEARQKIEEKRENAQIKSTEKRQEACERRVANIEAKFDRLDQHANRLLSVIDSFYAKVTGFYERGQLTVSNYDELLASVDEAKASAAAEVAALENLSVDIDCTDPDVAVSVATFRETTSSARTALKAYRAALVDLISAMHAAAAEDNADESTGENDDVDDGTENEDETEQEPEDEEESDEDTETPDESSED